MTTDMTSKMKIRVRHTPNCLHPYAATIKGDGAYGWGNTPDEARECLRRMIEERATYDACVSIEALG